VDELEERERERERDAEMAVWRVYKSMQKIRGWEMMRERVKDYIRHPKASGYQSLHATMVHASSGLHLEVQLRTRHMHYEAEYGSASHNNYKSEGRGYTPS